MENVMSSPESRLKPDHEIQLSDTASGVQPAGSESKQGPNTTTSSKAESLLAAEKRRLEMTPNEQNKAQSTSYFGCGKANAADCLDLPAKWVFLQPRSNVVLLGGWQGRRIGQRGIRRCGRLTAGLLVLLR